MTKQTTQWLQEKVQNDNDPQNTTQQIKDWATRTSRKTGGELVCSGKVSSSFSTGGTRRITLNTNPMLSDEWGKDRSVFTINKHIRGTVWYMYSISVNRVMVATVKLSKGWL